MKLVKNISYPLIRVIEIEFSRRKCFDFSILIISVKRTLNFVPGPKKKMDFMLSLNREWKYIA